MKYNFKVGEKVQIYRKPVDGLGVDISELPEVGSVGSVIDYIDCIEGEGNEYNGIPYVRIKFDCDNLNNSWNPCTRYWAIPCSCLKRVKEEKIIKVPAKSDEYNCALCVSDSEKICYYWNDNCMASGRYPTCSEEQIVWLKVK